jgi:ribosome-associated toxin RatA of RatAB toxin-antitoxin module
MAQALGRSGRLRGWADIEKLGRFSGQSCLQLVKTADFFSPASSDNQDAKSSGIEWEERKLITGTTQEQMYRVIADVNSYSTFVPYVTRSTEWPERARGDAYKEAELEVGFLGLVTESYTSKVDMVPCSKVTTRTEDSRLFSHLTSKWRLGPGVTSNSLFVDFSVEFGFRNPAYQNLASVFLEDVVKKMMDAFTEEARARTAREEADRTQV